ncbi:MAG: pilus assembly protein TadG-related protein [Pseudomonadota bacterium]
MTRSTLLRTFRHARSVIAARAKRFCACRRGNVIGTFTIGIAATMGIGGAALDYTALQLLKGQLQSAADHAAVSAAKELYMANTRPATIAKVATRYVVASLGSDAKGVKKSVSTNKDKTAITVKLAKTYQPLVLAAVYSGSYDLEVTATAAIMPGGRLCVIALEPRAPIAIGLSFSAKLTAEKCAVWSNSTSKWGVGSLNDAEINSEITCSAGGYQGFASNFTPPPETDCPTVKDPLGNRASPPVSACKKTGFSVNTGSHTFTPGTYCGGLTIEGTAKATFKPGIYVFKDGPLLAMGTATLEGEYIGFFFTGRDSHMYFSQGTSIDLTAPKDGVMAGILIFQDRHDPAVLPYTITSDDARQLLGTIYLPRGDLIVDGDRPVADRSAYTAIIARRLLLSSGPNLVLNSDYTSTDVPVPEGIGPVGGNIRLIE